MEATTNIASDAARRASAYESPERRHGRSRFRVPARSLALVGLSTVALSTLWGMPGARAETPKALEGIPVEGFTQLIPRGGIPAIVDPVFVDAADANMPDDAWILGYAAGGEAYAYDLNVLNSHEIVNHEAAGAAIAAVW